MNTACFASSTSRIPDANSLVGIEDYLRYAAFNNASLKGSFQSWKAAVEAITQAKSLPDPKFNYGYFIREVETRAGPQRQKFDIMQNERLARKKSYPNIGIGLSYIGTAHALASGVSDSGKDPIVAMVSLNLPIWTDSYKAAERQARAQLSKTRQEKIQLENTLGARAQQLLYEFEDTGRKIHLYSDIVIPKTKEMALASETAYQAATIDFLSLIDAQDKLLKYELLYERAVAQNAQKLAKLERLAGTALPAVDSDSGSQKGRETKPQKQSAEK